MCDLWCVVVLCVCFVWLLVCVCVWGLTCVLLCLCFMVRRCVVRVLLWFVCAFFVMCMCCVCDVVCDGVCWCCACACLNGGCVLFVMYCDVGRCVGVCDVGCVCAVIV